MRNENSLIVSTGDIREAYVTLGIVSTRVEVDPKTMKASYRQASTAAIEELQGLARELGGNGVIWIRFSYIEGFVPSLIYASGTAIHVKTER
jgi:uncharacterized protein YbjQ (UPF0145 family)